MSVTCLARDWAQKSMSVHEEEPPCDLIQGGKAAVYSALLQSLPNQFFKHDRDTVRSSLHTFADTIELCRIVPSMVSLTPL